VKPTQQENTNIGNPAVVTKMQSNAQKGLIKRKPEDLMINICLKLNVLFKKILKMWDFENYTYVLLFAIMEKHNFHINIASTGSIYFKKKDTEIRISNHYKPVFNDDFQGDGFVGNSENYNTLLILGGYTNYKPKTVKKLIDLYKIKLEKLKADAELKQIQEKENLKISFEYKLKEHSERILNFKNKALEFLTPDEQYHRNLRNALRDYLTECQNVDYKLYKVLYDSDWHKVLNINLGLERSEILVLFELFNYFDLKEIYKSENK